MSVKWMKPVNIGFGFVGAREHATKALEQPHLGHENRIPSREAAANAHALAINQPRGCTGEDLPKPQTGKVHRLDGGHPDQVHEALTSPGPLNPGLNTVKPLNTHPGRATESLFSRLSRLPSADTREMRITSEAMEPPKLPPSMKRQYVKVLQGQEGNLVTVPESFRRNRLS